jgi:hypothetical protein
VNWFKIEADILLLEPGIKLALCVEFGARCTRPAVRSVVASFKCHGAEYMDG